MDVFGFLIVIIALVGTVLNIKQMWQGFLLWTASNMYWCHHNFVIGEYPQSFLFFIYTWLSVYGLFEWLRNEP